MTDIFLTLTPDSDTRLDTLEGMAEAAEAEGVEVLVIGATARDLILHHGYEVKSPRATQDVDFGASVESWEDYERLLNNLLARGWTRRRKEQRHRLHYDEYRWIDIVPFGAIENPDGTIAWPPSSDQVMSTVGFAEALSHALVFELPSGRRIAVASLASQVLLKVVSWFDRREPRDISDLSFILSSYGEAGHLERVFEGAPPLAERYNYEVDTAMHHLVGSDVRGLVSRKTMKHLIRLLEAELSSPEDSRFVQAYMRYAARSSQFDAFVERLRALRSGLAE